MGIFSTFGLTLVGAFFLYGSNLFFCMIFLKQVTQDLAFKYWSQNYHRTYKWILILGALSNFKLFRLIYGQLLGKEQFNAAFDEP